MNKKTKVLGDKDKKNGIDDLLKKAGKDSKIEEIVGKKKKTRKRKTPKNVSGFMKKFTPCRESYKLIRGIDTQIKFERRTGAVLHGIGNFNLHTHDSALLALAYLASGREKAASIALKIIEEEADICYVDGGFYSRMGVRSGPSPQTSLSNLSIALAYMGFNRREDAEKLIELTENEIGFKKYRLIQDTIRAEEYYTANLDDNALLALAYFNLGRKKEARQLIKDIEEHFGFSYYRGVKLVNPRAGYGKNDSYIKPSNNALLALAYFAAGKKEKALELIEDLEYFYGFNNFDSDTKLVWDKDRSNCYTFDNTALALAYMAREYHENNKK